MPVGALTPNVGSRDEDNRGGEDVNIAIIYLFADGNRRKFPDVQGVSKKRGPF